MISIQAGLGTPGSRVSPHDLLDSTVMQDKDHESGTPQSTPSESAEAVRIGRPGPSRLLEAVERLLKSDRRHAERFMRFARDSRMSLDHVWCAMDSEGRIKVTVLGSPNPGRTAMLFASSPHSTDEAALVGRVVERTCQGLREANIALAQALLEPSERLDQESFIFGGLRRLATLTYMERAVPRRRNTISQPDFPSGVRLERYQSEQRGTLETLLTRTYEQTLDCPGLSGLRDPSDVVEGHMHSGVFRPEWWFVAYREDRAVGVMLLNGSVGTSSIELVYLGIVPEERGRGLGPALLQHGLNLIAGARERNVVLAVDEENVPALRMYENAGFRRTIRRDAFVRTTNDDSVEDTSEGD